MAMLYLDTSDHLILGLLGADFRWLSYVDTQDKKNAGRLHAVIQELCAKHALKVSDLTDILSIAGPGSYTGMRLSEGFAQVMEWQEKNKRAFYHFDVPIMDGKTQGVFIANAFKGEWYVRTWHAGGHEELLVPEENMLQHLKSLNMKEFYMAVLGDVLERTWGQTLNQDGHQFISTATMIQDRPEIFLAKVFEQEMARELFYYRPIEKEFRVSG